MDNFNFYAKYYDLLYSDKDYNAEVNYLNTLINKFGDISNKKILDLGCGTGIHANIFSKLGYKVDGVDMSLKMINQAKSKHVKNLALSFFQSNITEFRNEKQYNVVTSLFHVISYQNSNVDLLNAFKTAYVHLKQNGLFIFDFWYGPGVLTDRPEPRVKKLENSLIMVERKAKPVLHVNDNVVDVNYDIMIRNKETQDQQQILEKHSMRYFFINELTFYLKTVGFETLNYFEWMTLEVPDTNSWNVVLIARKV